VGYATIRIRALNSSTALHLAVVLGCGKNAVTHPSEFPKHPPERGHRLSDASHETGIDARTVGVSTWRIGQIRSELAAVWQAFQEGDGGENDATTGRKRA
jgi:hypothetical protein